MSAFLARIAAIEIQQQELKDIMTNFISMSFVAEGPHANVTDTTGEPDKYYIGDVSPLSGRSHTTSEQEETNAKHTLAMPEVIDTSKVEPDQKDNATAAATDSILKHPESVSPIAEADLCGQPSYADVQAEGADTASESAATDLEKEEMNAKHFASADDFVEQAAVATVAVDAGGLAFSGAVNCEQGGPSTSASRTMGVAPKPPIYDDIYAAGACDEAAAATIDQNTHSHGDPDAPADYRGEAGQNLLKAHLVGSCCSTCLAGPGKRCRQLRAQVKKIVFLAFSHADHNKEGDHILTYKTPKGSHMDVLFPATDMFPENWQNWVDWNTA